uniref:Tolloid-like protein 2 (inferred by orthology to a human protein) n=1 Tax=Strongyloides venezuelensis TaxID=75913 RepID=A0A0K0FSA6_STRVS
MKSDKRCNTTTFKAFNKEYFYWIAADLKCLFHIQAGEGKKIELTIYMSNSPYRSICTQDISHQIKYLENKGTTGLLLCSWRYWPIQVKSESSCQNSGYVHYNNNGSCICPFGYTGKFCNEIMKSDERCNTTTFNATSTVFYYWIAAYYDCYFHIKAGEGKKIELTIYMSNSPYRSICTQDISHQIKYLENKGTTGLLLCSWRYWPIQVKSESNTVLIYFNGDDNNAFIQFGFKEVY